MRIARLRTSDGIVIVAETPEGYRRILGDPDSSVAVDPATAELGDAVVGEVLAPIAPGKIVAIGLNYLDHIREASMDVPRSPLIFTKFTSSVVGTGAAIRFDPSDIRRVDWEVELAVVIGTTTKSVPAERALESVFGYTIANDVSAREAQFADGQWVRGKSLDTFCPLGPVIVTADEIPDPQALALGTRVNGESVQNSSTKEMVFGVADLISYCSRFFTLGPGDLILSGTPWGCGEFMTPQRSLQDGDVVETWIDGIGSITNPVSAPVA